MPLGCWMFVPGLWRNRFLSCSCQWISGFVYMSAYADTRTCTSREARLQLRAASSWGLCRRLFPEVSSPYTLFSWFEEKRNLRDWPGVPSPKGMRWPAVHNGVAQCPVRAQHSINPAPKSGQSSVSQEQSLGPGLGNLSPESPALPHSHPPGINLVPTHFLPSSLGHSFGHCPQVSPTLLTQPPAPKLLQLLSFCPHLFLHSPPSHWGKPWNSVSALQSRRLPLSSVWCSAQVAAVCSRLSPACSAKVFTIPAACCFDLSTNRSCAISRGDVLKTGWADR